MVRAESRRDPVDAETYSSLMQFYAAHLRFRDNKDTEGWLAAFTAEATLTSNSLDPPVELQKADFGPKMFELDQMYVDAGLERSHVVSNFRFWRRPDSAVVSRSYGILVTTDADSRSKVSCAAVATDVLMQSGETWVVLSRSVMRDDLAQRQNARSDTAEEAK